MTALPPKLSDAIKAGSTQSQQAYGTFFTEPVDPRPRIQYQASARDLSTVRFSLMVEGPLEISKAYVIGKQRGVLDVMVEIGDDTRMFHLKHKGGAKTTQSVETIGLKVPPHSIIRMSYTPVLGLIHQYRTSMILICAKDAA